MSTKELIGAIETLEQRNARNDFIVQETQRASFPVAMA